MQREINVLSITVMSISPLDRRNPSIGQSPLGFSKVQLIAPLEGKTINNSCVGALGVMSDKTCLFRACDFSDCIHKFACGTSGMVVCKSATESISLIIKFRVLSFSIVLSWAMASSVTLSRK